MTTTAEVKSRLEYEAAAHGYKVQEWLKPGLNGNGLRVACTMMIGGQQHGLAFKWSGEKIGELVTRCIALDYSMQKLPAAVKAGKVAPWTDH
jgi:hypothetical protein